MKRLVSYLTTIDKKWLATWVLIYLGFNLLAAFFPDFIGATILKMLGLILCVVYAAVKFKDDPLLVLALGFTLLADTVLLINNISITGVFVFCIAQFFHTARLKKTNPAFLIFYLAIITAVFFIATALGVDQMYAAAGIYAYSLLSNLYFSVRWFFERRSVASTCACAGFLLFLCCDLCVAMSYLSVTAVLPAFLHGLGDYLAWVFYYPSQILISNSSFRLEAREFPEDATRQKKLAEKSKGVLQ